MECRMALEPMQGNRVSSPVDLGYKELFCIPVVISVSSRLVTVFFQTLWSSITQIKAPYLFDGEHGIALHTMHGTQASSRGEVEVS